MSKVRWLVVIAYDGTPVVTEFENESDARAFFEPAQANWSEAYLCRVVKIGAVEIDEATP